MVGANPRALNGGTNRAGSKDATLTLAALGTLSDRKVNGALIRSDPPAAAAGGNGGPYSYDLTSAPEGLAGLSFDPNTRVLSGMPEEEKGRWTFTATPVHACIDGTVRQDNTPNWTGPIGSNGGSLEDKWKSTPCGKILPKTSD